jgi:hypothetical protein
MASQTTPNTLHRHASAIELPSTSTRTQLLTPEHLTSTNFPCSHRRQQNPNNTRAPRITTPSPLPQLLQQDRLQTALLYLARAAAQLPPARAQSLYLFASPNCTPEAWEAVVERERAAAAARRSQAGREGEARSGRSEMVSPGVWMERAVGVLKREGEEGEYWRDGRDLQVLWERVEGGDV